MCTIPYYNIMLKFGWGSIFVIWRVIPVCWYVHSWTLNCWYSPWNKHLCMLCIIHNVLYVYYNFIYCTFEQSWSRQSTLHTTATPLPVNSDCPRSPQPQPISPPPLLPLLIMTVIASVQPVYHPPLAACTTIACVLYRGAAVKIALRPALQKTTGT